MARVGVSLNFDVIRPFGSATVISTGNAGVLYDDIPCGRGSGLSGILMWTHYLDFDASIDVIDGCTRFGGSDGLLYGDGDEIDTTVASSAKFVVVFVVAYFDDATSTLMRRAYLLRDAP